MMMGFGFAIQGDLKADQQAWVGHKGLGKALLWHIPVHPSADSLDSSDRFALDHS
jgi:hypothetical protein